MPTQPLRRCSFPNCRNRVKFGRCEEHQQKKVDEYLKHNPLCVRCLEIGRYTPATVIDHIKPVENGQADPLFWRVDNHQALCRDCHSYKTRVIDKRGFGAKK